MRIYLLLVIVASSSGLGWSHDLRKERAEGAVHYYCVGGSDTYESIARHAVVDAVALKRLNGNVRLRQGTILLLPGKSVDPRPQSQIRVPQVEQPEQGLFVVATGDTYQRIAKLKGVDEGALRALNANIPIKVGRILQIPKRPVRIRPEN